MTTPLRVALVGCGQIADAHLQELSKIETANVVGVCDSYHDLAEQAAVRFGVGHSFTNVERMLAEAAPDVVHITTPPHTHLPIAVRCIAAGAHVYVEKPFTLDVYEANRLLDAAEQHERLVCVGHDQLFQPVWQECLRFIDSGALGTIVGVDCIRGYDLAGPYGSLIASDRNHWIHRLPGGVFQNVISHAVCLFTPFLPPFDRSVMATWFGIDSNAPLPTELRAVVRSGHVTATVTVTSRSRPVQRLARVSGTRGTIEVDFDSGLIRGVHSPRLPGAFGRIETPVRHAIEASRHVATTLRRFIRADIHYFAGMNALFQAFYAAITDRQPLPIAYKDIRDVTAVMDDIFKRCAADPLAIRRGVA